MAAGVVLTGTTSNSVTIAGTSLARSTFTVSVSAIDRSAGNGPFNASGVFSLSAGASIPVLSPASGSLDARYAAAFSSSVSVSGGTGLYRYAIVGALPNRLSFDGITGTISSAPTQTGTFPITVTATDTGATGPDGAFTVEGNFTVYVAAPAIVVTPATLPNATSGTPYALRLTASNAAARYSFTLTDGALPAGLALSADGDLTGTPTASGSFAFTLTARDANRQTSAANLSLAVDITALAIRPDTLSRPSQGFPCNQSLFHFEQGCILSLCHHLRQASRRPDARPGDRSDQLNAVRFRDSEFCHHGDRQYRGNCRDRDDHLYAGDHRAARSRSPLRGARSDPGTGADQPQVRQHATEQLYATPRSHSRHAAG